jgi:hypothetical protein
MRQQRLAHLTSGLFKLSAIYDAMPSVTSWVNPSFMFGTIPYFYLLVHSSAKLVHPYRTS